MAHNEHNEIVTSSLEKACIIFHSLDSWTEAVIADIYTGKPVRVQTLSMAVLDGAEVIPRAVYQWH